MRLMPELLRDRANADPDGRAYTFLDDGEREGARMTWGELDRRASALAAAIAAVGGARIAGADPVSARAGVHSRVLRRVLRARAIAVSAYPPRTGRAGIDPQDRTLARLRAIASDASPAVILAPSALAQRAAAVTALVPELSRAPGSTSTVDRANEDFPDVSIDPGSVAFLQYTSGSTAEPRGVMVTHANLVHNLADSQALAGHDRTSASVSWLPVIHDMGLIQGVLQPAFSGFPAWLMSPAAFLQRPARWLRAISATGATISGGPNFAYELCVRRVSDQEREGLDLRRWRLAFNGAEPIRQSTLDAFRDMFAPQGFDAGAFRPCYGLAEATLLVSTGRGATTACGHAAGGHRHPHRRSPHAAACASSAPRLGRSGSPGLAWRRATGTSPRPRRRPSARGSPAAAKGPFLRTGDLGVLREDGLHVTGRIKDILIVRGIKHFPQDIEGTVERASPWVRAGCCAVFAMPGGDGDAVAVAAELDSAGDSDAVILNIREAIGAAHGIQVSAVALVAPGAIPKTTSGKLQRFLCREGLLNGRLTPLSFWAA